MMMVVVVVVVVYLILVTTGGDVLLVGVLFSIEKTYFLPNFGNFVSNDTFFGVLFTHVVFTGIKSAVVS